MSLVIHRYRGQNKHSDERIFCTKFYSKRATPFRDLEKNDFSKIFFSSLNLNESLQKNHWYSIRKIRIRIFLSFLTQNSVFKKFKNLKNHFLIFWMWFNDLKCLTTSKIIQQLNLINYIPYFFRFLDFVRNTSKKNKTAIFRPKI